MRIRPLAALLHAVLAVAACSRSDAPSAAFERARAHAAVPEREWRVYLGGRVHAQFSPLDQVRRDNVGRLEVAWRHDTGEAHPHGGSQMQCNPLVVRGVLYATTPRLRVIALDAATGEELWSFDPAASLRTGLHASRGLVYWADGDDERILFGAGCFLFALDARTGRPLDGFGEHGRVDLRVGLREEPVADEFLGIPTPGSLYGDLLVIGSRVSETRWAAPGHVRAFDVRSGEQRWIFHTIPQPGQPFHDAWPPDAWRRVGGANSWAGLAVDDARGLVFVPTGSATYDFYGPDRLGDNPFANSLLALDARTGERRWHFQVVRHDVWDRDLPSPPNLVTIERDGRRIDAVAQPTKTGHVFVFERETGAPLFPIAEIPVEGEPLPGERLAASQPVPLRPPPLTRTRFDADAITDRTPEARAAVLARMGGARTGGPYVAPALEGVVVQPGLDGGAEWGGAAWDAQTGLLYVNVNDVPYLLEMAEAPRLRENLRPGNLRVGGRMAYLTSCAGCHGRDRRGDAAGTPSLVDVAGRLQPWELWRIAREGRGRMPGNAYLYWYELGALLAYLYFPADVPLPAAGEADDAESVFPRFMNVGLTRLEDHEGLPGSKPPWGTLAAVHLGRGEIVWQVPLGEIPQLAAQGLRDTGAPNYGGPVVTAGGLVFIAATPDEKLRAFDKTSGEELWEAALPAAGFATPAVYETDGRQFVVIAAGGGKLGRPSGGSYVAFALPAGARAF